MQAPPAEDSGRIRFPALDPEPPRRPWRRWALKPAIGLAVVALVAGGAEYARTGGRRKEREATPSVPNWPGLWLVATVRGDCHDIGTH